ncbi:MAG: hypothetical protein OEW12_04685, partial [Deltaproteobacteria bacterium]|nr:hypothetical protein [Deltaproteobacteria bacterium]
AIDLNPKYSPSYIAMADMLVKKGGTANLKEAIGFLSQASLNDPLNVNIYFSAAKIYSALNMRAEEMVEKKKVSVVKTLETDPHNSVANNNMGVLTLQQERVHEAMEYFKKALVQNPGYDVAYRNMSLVQLKLAGATTEKEKRTELLEKGITFIQKALSIHPKGLPNMLAYAKLLMSQDKYKEALDVLEAGEKIDSANREIFGLKKTIYIKMNMVEEAQNAAAIYETLSNHEAGR